MPECGELVLELVVGTKIKVPVREKRKSSKVINFSNRGDSTMLVIHHFF